MSFKKQLIIILVLFSLIPMLIVGITGVTIAINSADTSSNEQLTTLARTNGTSLNALIASQRREVSLMANRYSVVEQLSWESTEQTKKAVDKFLDDWIDSEKTYDNAVITDVDGLVIWGYHDGNIGINLSDADYFINAMRMDETYVSNSTFSILNAEIPVIVMSRRIDGADGNPIGAIMLYISSEFFDSFINDIKLGSDGYAFLTDSNRTAIYHPKKNLIGMRSSNSPLESILAGYREGAGGKSGAYELRYDGTDRMMYYYILDEAPWVLIFTQTQDELHSSRDAVLWVTAIIALICIILLLAASDKFAKRVSEPVNTLAQAFAHSYESGIYQPCHIEGNIEFVALADNYNAMTAKINSYNSVLEDMAYHDQITGLANWAFFEQQLHQKINSGLSGGIISIDLDDFKSINDIYGREFGNEVLKELSHRLLHGSHDFDLCARIGGDEFCLIKTGTGDDVIVSVKELLSKFAQPFVFGEVIIELALNIGVALYPEHGTTVESICKNAEIAMHKSKISGKNIYALFDETMKNSIVRHNQVESIVKNCIEQNSIFLVYQPEVNPETDKIKAFEALMRIQDADAGFISPVEFIPIAESSGHIIKIGKWILETACRFAKSLCESRVDFDAVSVNVSSLQLLERSFVDDVLAILDKVGLPPEHLQLEITESVLIRNMKATIDKLSRLREHGITVALDDFGTSYSSLTYLTELPIDVLKIDKSFIDDICDDKKRQTVTRTIIEMSHEMGLKVVAEGVEDTSQLQLLKGQGCDLIQGYFYSKPVINMDAFKMIAPQARI